MKSVKKLLSLIICLTIIFSSLITADAKIFEYGRGKTPVINISGDSVPICDENDELVFSTKYIQRMISDLTADMSAKEIARMLIDKFNYMLFAYMKGSITRNFNDYYDSIYNVFSEVFEKALLDKNGNAQYGTRIKKSRLDDMNQKKYQKHEIYDTETYRFVYDWRLDPLEIADELHEYIQTIKQTTGFDKVGILARCLGGNVTLAYIAKYGTQDIKGVVFDGVICFGSELLGEPVSGKLVFDLGAINRTLLDLNAVGILKINPAITDAICAVDKSGIDDIVKALIKFPDYRFVKDGIISSLALSTIYTWPSYWAAISSNDYENAKNVVFGKEGDKRRADYSGLIEKLDNYDRLVRQRIPELLNEIDKNCNLAIISKYGVQCAPISQSRFNIGDQFSGVNYSSVGATAGLIYQTLSDEYIENRAKEGKEKYISPDGLIDASTCLFPDQTFFVKGATHSDWTYGENQLAFDVIDADRQLTVNDTPYTQFTVFSYETDKTVAMTKDNCDTEYWTVNKSDYSFAPFTSMKIFFRALSLLKADIKQNNSKKD